MVARLLTNKQKQAKNITSLGEVISGTRWYLFELQKSEKCIRERRYKLLNAPCGETSPKSTTQTQREVEGKLGKKSAVTRTENHK